MRTRCRTVCALTLIGASSPICIAAVTGTVMWTDASGGTHPSRGVRIELFLMHTDGRPHEHIGSGATEIDGSYSFDTSRSLGTGDQWQAIALAEHDGARSNYTGLPADGVYAIHSAGASTALIPPMVADNVSTDGRAFAVADALYSSWYYGTHMTTGITKRAIQFPALLTGFDPASKLIQIVDAKWDKWDAVTHEYGHYLADLTDTETQPAVSAHSFGVTNIPKPSLLKDGGCRLAWGEGLATYHGIASQRFDIAGQHTPMTAPFVGDTDYGFGGSTPSVGIESDATTIPQGEGDELAVARILWDITDAGGSEAWDEWSIPQTTLFSTIDSIGSIDRLDQLWDHYTTITPDAQLATLGAIFEHNSVSPEPTGSLIDATVLWEDAPPTFTWNAGNFEANDDFSILFFDSLFTTRIGTGWLVGSDLFYTPSASEWDDLTDYVALHGDTTFNWVITGADRDGYTGADITGDYWSGARSFTLRAPVPTPGTLALAGACAAGGVRQRRTWITPCARPT